MRYDLFNGKGAISKFLLERRSKRLQGCSLEILKGIKSKWRPWGLHLCRNVSRRGTSGWGEIVGCYRHVESGGPILTAGSEGGHILTPRWAGGWTCTSHPGVFGLMPKREEPGKTGHHPVLKHRVPHGSQPRPGWAPDLLMVGIRSPDGLVVGLAPATLEFWVRFPNERNQGNRAPPCVKVPGSSRVPGRTA